MRTNLTNKPLDCKYCQSPIELPRPSHRMSCDSCKAIGFYSLNKTRLIEKAKIWKAAHPEALKISSHKHYVKVRPRHRQFTDQWKNLNPDKCRAWAASHRAKRRGAFVEHVDFAAVWLAHKGFCGICGRAVSFHTMHLDHVVSMANGGKHEFRNCQPAHPTCNYSKGARDINAPIQKELYV